MKRSGVIRKLVVALAVVFCFICVQNLRSAVTVSSSASVAPVRKSLATIGDVATKVVVSSLSSIKAQRNRNRSEQDGKLVLPHRYPVHQKLPSRLRLLAGITQRQGSSTLCSSNLPVEGTVLHYAATAAKLSTITDEVRSKLLEKEFNFPNPSNEVFFSHDSLLTSFDPDGEEPPWWISKPAAENANLPCTQLAQRRLWERQHPPDCSKAAYLISNLKEGAHGVGSALTLVAHDFLSAIMLERVLLLHSKNWYFAPSACGPNRKGWECFFSPPSECSYEGVVQQIHSKSQALRGKAKAVSKKTFDIAGLSRNDIPTLEQFFGGAGRSSTARCVDEVTRWASDDSNLYLMGTFDKGADPVLFYMLAQVLRFLMRAPQPWFSAMLRHHLPLVGMAPSSDGVVVYVQERGEVAKYREYYNAFGCHTVKQEIFSDFTTEVCRSLQKQSSANPPSCSIYVSGNTPFRAFTQLQAAMEGAGGIGVRSTWLHPDMVKKRGETERWGASTAAASWVDLYAGVASTHWVCIVQSNWCRMINLLRLTADRAHCGFVDVGILMLASFEAREKYCIVREDWPTKPFSNRLK